MANQLPEYLQDSFIRKYCEYASVDTALTDEIIYWKEQLIANEDALEKIKQYHERFIQQKMAYKDVFPENPKLIETFGGNIAGTMLFLLVLSGLPWTIAEYQRRGWDDTICRETFRDMGIWSRHNKRNTGNTGLTWTIVGWFAGHLKLSLVGFGRLQFNVSMNMPEGITFFRNKKTSRILALVSNDKQRFTAAGLPDDLQEEPSPNCWYTTWQETDALWIGHPIKPDGYVLPHKATLTKRDWEIILKEGDPVINTHIPEAGPMTPEMVLDSRRRAAAFFAKHLPEYHWKAFFCESWLLDPQLNEILSPTSNIAVYRKRSYLIPCDLGEADTIWRCLGQQAVDHGVDAVPHTTGLQKAIAAFVKSGRKFHCGSSVLFPEDVEKDDPYHFPDGGTDDFACTCCGACCRWEGPVRVTAEEVRKIAEYLQIPEAEFLEKHTILAADRRSLSLKERADGSCIYYDPETFLCRIQAVKPKQCSDFPFNWKFKDWQYYCPGSDAKEQKKDGTNI